jgi:hypothetical protein
MSALLDQATKEVRQGNLDLKKQVRHIGNYFTNCKAPICKNFWFFGISVDVIIRLYIGL